MRRRLLGTALSVLLALSGTAALAEEEPTRSEPVVVGEDPSGDAEVAGVGADLTAATVTVVGDEALAFGLQVADMPAVVNGSPEFIHYNWDISVESADGTTKAYALQAIRTAQWEHLSDGQPPSDQPVFRLNTCSPDATTGQNTCTVTYTPEGSFSAEGLEMILPYEIIKAAPGDIVMTTAQINASAGAAGLVWYTNGVGGDLMWADDFVIPGSDEPSDEPTEAATE